MNLLTGLSSRYTPNTKSTASLTDRELLRVWGLWREPQSSRLQQRRNVPLYTGPVLGLCTKGDFLGQDGRLMCSVRLPLHIFLPKKEEEYM